MFHESKSPKVYGCIRLFQSTVVLHRQPEVAWRSSSVFKMEIFHRSELRSSELSGGLLGRAL
jgi:hypothetical protein